jgi:hypothetical protein
MTRHRPSHRQPCPGPEYPTRAVQAGGTGEAAWAAGSVDVPPHREVASL